MSEHDQQKMVCQWMDANGIKYFAVPNAAKRSPKTAAYLKAEGMQPGVPDLIILTPPPDGVYRGVACAAIEMKEPGKKPTPKQLEWGRWFTTSERWVYTVAYSAGEAIAWLQWIGHGR